TRCAPPPENVAWTIALTSYWHSPRLCAPAPRRTRATPSPLAARSPATAVPPAGGGTWPPVSRASSMRDSGWSALRRGQVPVAEPGQLQGAIAEPVDRQVAADAEGVEQGRAGRHRVGASRAGPAIAPLGSVEQRRVWCRVGRCERIVGRCGGRRLAGHGGGIEQAGQSRLCGEVPVDQGGEQHSGAGGVPQRPVWLAAGDGGGDLCGQVELVEQVGQAESAGYTGGFGEAMGVDQPGDG